MIINVGERSASELVRFAANQLASMLGVPCSRGAQNEIGSKAQPGVQADVAEKPATRLNLGVGLYFLMGLVGGQAAPSRLSTSASSQIRVFRVRSKPSIIKVGRFHAVGEVQNESGSKAQPGVQADVFASPLLRFCSSSIARQKRGLTQALGHMETTLVNLEVVNAVFQPVLASLAVFAAFLSIVGAFKSGAIKKFRFGAFELAGPDAEREALEASLRQALTSKEQKENIPFEVEQLTNYYSQILAQSKISFWFSLVFASLGFVAILLAAFLYTEAKQGTTVAQFIAGTIMEAVASLFFVQSKNAQKSMGEFFDKLRKDRLHMESRKLCDDIEERLVKDALKLHLSLHYAGVEGAAAIAQGISGSIAGRVAQQGIQPDGPASGGSAG